MGCVVVVLMGLEFEVVVVEGTLLGLVFEVLRGGQRLCL